MTRSRVVTSTLASVVTALLLSAAPGALAQADQLKKQTPEQRAKLQTDLMKSKLALTPEQTATISAMNEKYAQRMEPIIKGSEGPFMKMRQMKQVSEAKEAELKAILSPDQ